MEEMLTDIVSNVTGKLMDKFSSYWKKWWFDDYKTI